MNKPFLFSNSSTEHQSLIVSLQAMKVNVVEVHNGYDSRMWHLSFPWQKEAPLVIEWQQKWWPCGEVKEDVAVRVKLDKYTIGSIDFSSLGGSKRNLRKEIKELIVSMVKEAIAEKT